MRRPGSSEKRRHFVYGIVACAAPLAFVFACGFPDVTFLSTASTGASAEDGEDGGCGCAHEEDGGARPEEMDAAEPNRIDAAFQPAFDVVARPDGAARIADASVCAERTPCDCDGDGFAAVSCPYDPSSIAFDGGTLKKGDCDDLDPMRFPGQTFVSETLGPGADGDWDCSGFVQEYPGELECGGNWFDRCDWHKDARGFLNDPPCGEAADLHVCAPQEDPYAPCQAVFSGYQITRACR